MATDDGSLARLAPLQREIRRYGTVFEHRAHRSVPDSVDEIARHLADAEIIGLGEATHGTREIVELKAALVKSLISKEGLRLVCLEAGFAATLDINAYVLGRTAPTASPLADDHVHHPFKVETMADLLEWIREFNADRPPQDRVRIHGIDNQHAEPAVAVLRTVLAELQPEAAAEVHEALDILDGSMAADMDEAALAAHLAARQRTVGAVLSFLETAHLDDLPGRYVRDEQLLRRLCWSLEQGYDQLDAARAADAPDTQLRIRDRAMAAQLNWLLEYEDVEQAVFWGHNAHVGCAGRHRSGLDLSDPIRSVGKRLTDTTERTYNALGILIGGGSVRALHRPTGELRVYEMAPPPAGSLPGVLRDLTPAGFYIDFDAMPAGSSVAGQLSREQTNRQVMGTYIESPVEQITETVTTQYDGIVFLPETTPTRPLDAMLRPPTICGDHGLVIEDGHLTPQVASGTGAPGA